MGLSQPRWFKKCLAKWITGTGLGVLASWNIMARFQCQPGLYFPWLILAQMIWEAGKGLDIFASLNIMTKWHSQPGLYFWWLAAAEIFKKALLASLNIMPKCPYQPGLYFEWLVLAKTIWKAWSCSHLGQHEPCLTVVVLAKTNDW